MKIVSLNLGVKRTVSWRGKPVQTGIYKSPVKGPIMLGKEDVEEDQVIDRRYHGGTDKACYIYSADHYAYWKELFPALKWEYGMFGENLTVQGLQESDLLIGDVLRIGGATVQVSQPRQPCFKLGIRFGTQTVLKKFIAAGFPGIYVRVLDPAEVKLNDSVELIERPHDSLKISEIWDLLYSSEPDEDLLNTALDYRLLSEGCKESLRQVKKVKFG